MRKVFPYLLFAALIDALAIVFYMDTLHMPRAAYQMPRIFIVLILLLSVLMIVERIVVLRKRPSDEKGDGASAKLSPVRIAGFILLIFGYIVTISPLGYFLATPGFLVATFLFLRSTKMRWIAAIAVGFTVFVYLLFVLFLHMPVPMGLLA
jgi:putative tricarboxylic transport membrane protein